MIVQHDTTYVATGMSCLGKLSLPSLLRLRPDGIDPFFYLGDFFLVAAPFVVRYLSAELVNLFLFLPVSLAN